MDSGGAWGMTWGLTRGFLIFPGSRGVLAPEQVGYSENWNARSEHSW